MNSDEDIERLNTEVEDMSILVSGLATVQAKHNIPRLNNIENHINERPEVQKVSLEGISVITLKGDKGEKGDDRTNKELEELIIPLIPKPIKGDDGKDYVLTEKDKKEIAKNIKVPVVDKIIERIETIIQKPIVTNEIKEVAIYESAEEIRDKISLLKGEEKLDIKELKGVEKILEKFRSSLIFNTGAKVLSSLFDTNIQSPTNGQALVYNATTQKWENGNVSGGGSSTYATLTDATTVNLPVVNTPLATALSGKQDNISLTTTGSSGPATFTANVLNIPNYQGGGGGTNTAENFLDQSPIGPSKTLLIGLRNGTNTLYTVSQGAYVPGKLQVYRNGKLLTNDVGSVDMYTETLPASGTFTLNTAPLSTDVISAIYPKTGAAGTMITQDEGVTLSSATTTLNFIGTGVTTTNVGPVTTISITSGGDKNYTEAVIDMTTKIFTHNLNKYPSVSFIDTGNNYINGAVRHLTLNTTEITFSQAISGTATFN